MRTLFILPLTIIIYYPYSGKAQQYLKPGVYLPNDVKYQEICGREPAICSNKNANNNKFAINNKK